MKKIYIFLTCILISSTSIWRCSDFLNVAPNKSGSAELYHMDQLYQLIGNYNLYHGANRVFSCWLETLYFADGLDYLPYFIVNYRVYDEYTVWSGDFSPLKSMPEATMLMWDAVCNAIYTFNTVLENMDNVVQTTPAIRKQVEGEALFGRAYFHFLSLVQYALWDDNAPGIGYRVNTSPSEVPARETVKFTLDHIYQDLDQAEAALREAGRTQFDLARNFRPTVPTVKALKARVDLYRGNYTSALENANGALEGYNYLQDFKNDPLYAVSQQGTVNLLDQNDATIVGTKPYRRMLLLRDLGNEALWKHPEFYFPHGSQTVGILASYPVVTLGTNYISISESTYNRFDRENDERWNRFYFNNYMAYARLAKTITLPGNTSPTTYCMTWDAQQNTTESSHHTYQRFGSNKQYLIGLTTAEMYLIKAECLARSGNTSEAAEVLKTLRRTRFTTVESANNIGGSIAEVLEERAREMTEIWRFFDIKRLNGAENANISIRKTILTNRTDIKSTQEIVIAPNDPRWALPFTNQQIILMGWQQN